jgi:hypothetical protein
MSSPVLRRARPLLAAAALLLAPSVHAHGEHKHEDHSDHDHDGHAHGAHVHGVAHLDAALDGRMLAIEVRVPGWDLVGFEREPRDDAERAKVDSARTLLADGGRLFAFEPAGSCVPSGPGQVALPAALSEAKNDHAGHDHGHDHDHDHGHATGHPSDWSATWSFTCADPAALAAVRVEWFDAFPGTERIEVQWIGPAGQAGHELTPSTRRIPVAGR